jgi:hypothetical protein
MKKRLIFFLIFLVILISVFVFFTATDFFKKPEPLPTKEPVRKPEPSKVFLIDLEYLEGKLTLKNIEVKAGFSPDYLNQPEKGFLCEVLSKDRKILYSLKFDIFSPIPPPPLLEEVELKITPPFSIDVGLIIPYFKEAGKIVFRDPDGKVLLTVKAPRSLSKNFFPQVLAQDSNGYVTLINNGDPAEKLDVLYLGDDYSPDQLSLYRSDVEVFYQQLLNVEPFSTFAGNINIHRIDNTHDLGCWYSGRLIQCDTNQVLAVALNAPHDFIVVIVNNSQYGGSGGSLIAVAFRDTDPDRTGNGPRVAVHEIGHTFGRLADEYLAQYSGLRNAPNCTIDPKCSAWIDFPNTGCFQGCNFPDEYRSTENDCLMRTLDPSEGFHFCPVCRAHLTSLLQAYDQPTPTPTPTPTPFECHPDDQMIFMSQPSINQPLTIRVTSPRAYPWVVITVNGENQTGPDRLGGSYWWEWDYTPTASGQYTVRFYVNAEDDDPSRGDQCLERSFTITTPTPTPTPIPEDLNQDGVVNSQDIIILLQNWGDYSSVSEADFNSDDVVNGIDFGMMLKLIL